MNVDEIVYVILDTLSITPTKVLSKDIEYQDLFKAIILGGSIKCASELLDITDSTLEHILSRKLLKVLHKPLRTKWDTYLLSLISCKKCPVCKEYLFLSDFGYNSQQVSDVSSYCLTCDNTRCIEYANNHRKEAQIRSKMHYVANKADYISRNIKRKINRDLATPIWANLSAIKKMYNDCPVGYHVDHVIPLQGVLVSGLHVEYNLQYLSAEDNLKKSNKFVII